MNDFESEQVAIVAGSVDAKDKAEEIVQKNEITYPVAYGLNVQEVSRITGAYYEKDKQILHATGFIIRPDNRVEAACYSTGPIGRLVAKDALGLVRFYKSKKK